MIVLIVIVRSKTWKVIKLIISISLQPLLSQLSALFPEAKQLTKSCYQWQLLCYYCLYSKRRVSNFHLNPPPHQYCHYQISTSSILSSLFHQINLCRDHHRLLLVSHSKDFRFWLDFHLSPLSNYHYLNIHRH